MHPSHLVLLLRSSHGCPRPPYWEFTRGLTVTRMRVYLVSETENQSVLSTIRGDLLLNGCMIVLYAFTLSRYINDATPGLVLDNANVIILDQLNQEA